MTTDALIEELRATEGGRLRALVARDVQAADAFHADDYELITPSGATLSKADYLGQVASGEIQYRVFEPVSPIAVRSYEGAAILRYGVHIDIEWDGGGEKVDLWHTDLYELRDGRWQAVWSQATRIR